MGARFIGVDREQVFLMPPSVREWVPEGHLVWTVLDAVGVLDLSAIYADYRDDGRGRPAYEPSVMVAVLLFAYARGTRSSRVIECACVEEVAYRVVTGKLAMDHATIAATPWLLGTTEPSDEIRRMSSTRSSNRVLTRIVFSYAGGLPPDSGVAVMPTTHRVQRRLTITR
jgi:hypothetical protein